MQQKETKVFHRNRLAGILSFPIQSAASKVLQVIDLIDDFLNNAWAQCTVTTAKAQKVPGKPEMCSQSYPQHLVSGLRKGFGDNSLEYRSVS